MSKIHLGQGVLYPEKYDPTLLAPIAREAGRVNLPELGDKSFKGKDIWTAYELSWLNKQGVPQVAIAELEFDCRSNAIIESKSLKYYLNSLNQSFFDSWAAVEKTLADDLQKACGGEVNVRFYELDKFPAINAIYGTCVDTLSVNISHYTPEASILFQNERLVENKQLYSHLLKSNCPVTGQPDWATVWIEYSGKEINAESFLKYVVSYRQHQDYHEQCVEKIFSDITTQCQVDSLTVYARYTRRGGLDINPFRTNSGRALPFGRLSRQ